MEEWMGKVRTEIRNIQDDIHYEVSDSLIQVKLTESLGRLVGLLRDNCKCPGFQKVLKDAWEEDIIHPWTVI